MKFSFMKILFFNLMILVLAVTASFSQVSPLEIKPLDAEKLKGKIEHDLVVAQDGSGHFRTISEAVKAIRVYLPKPITVFIKAGVYKEKILIDGTLTGVTFQGEGAAKTIITYDDFAAKDNMGTFETYTVKVLGNSLTFRDLTFENTAGPVGQAVALHAEGDRLVFENCRFLGNQDTMFASGENSRQLYKNCYIEGTTDFIFGSATALFQNCTIHSKANSYITAASTPAWVEYGYVFQNCRLTAEPEVSEVYLGRPWRDFAKTVFINTEMGSHIRPEGWHNWGRENAEQTVLYAEYGSFGPGGSTDERVAWAKVLEENELNNYSLYEIFEGGNSPSNEFGDRWYGYEKDSSFNLESAWQKDRKSFPDIQPVQPYTSENVIAHRDLVYKKVGNRELKLDVFVPKEGEDFASLMMIHGGGWKSGDKVLQEPMALALAEMGFVTITVEYRLSPEAQYPAAVHDVKEAIRWVKSHRDQFLIDPDKVAISGSSAGAQMASLVGLTHTATYEGRTALSQNSEVKAIVNLDGVLAFHHPQSAEGQVASEWLGGNYEQIPEIWDEASPLYVEDPQLKPMLFINSQYPRFHAGRDELIEELKKANQYTQIKTFPDSPHPFWLYDIWFEETVQLIAEFLNKTL